LLATVLATPLRGNKNKIKTYTATMVCVIVGGRIGAVLAAAIA